MCIGERNVKGLVTLVTVSYAPVDKGSLVVEEVKLVVEARPGLRDGRGVGQHAQGARHRGQVPAGHHGGRHVVDAHLKEGGGKRGGFSLERIVGVKDPY